MKSDDGKLRDERTGAAGEQAEKGIAEARTVMARSSEEGRTIVINEDCRVRFSRWFEEPEK